MANIAVARALALPPGERGAALLQIPEDQWFDRKSARVAPQTLADAEVGFANAEGGTIVVGLRGGQVEGTNSNPKRTNDLRQAHLDHTRPSVRARVQVMDCAKEDGAPDRLLVIEVEPSEVVHANARDEVFLRVGDETRRLTFRQRQELTFDKGQASFDGSPLPDASREELDQELLDSYCDALQHPSADRLLAARGLITAQGEMTAAALLLFGTKPQAWFPEAYLRVLRYQGTERGTGSRQRILRDERLEGPIPDVLTEARAVIKTIQPARQALGQGGRFQAKDLIPEDAWLEGVVNAIVHRSYSIGGDHIRVEVFDDRIEIESPGRFPGLANVQDPLKITRFARNPRIARVCSDLSFGEELGEGIRRMYEEMRIAGLADPLYRQTGGSVRLTLLALAVDRDVQEKLPLRSSEILDALRQARQLSTGDIADALGMGRPAVLRRLRALEEAGLVEWVGKGKKDPRAYWRIKW
jgi:ATP-dependent DNA helicase RecG